MGAGAGLRCRQEPWGGERSESGRGQPGVFSQAGSAINSHVRLLGTAQQAGFTVSLSGTSLHYLNDLLHFSRICFFQQTLRGCCPCSAVGQHSGSVRKYWRCHRPSRQHHRAESLRSLLCSLLVPPRLCWVWLTAGWTTIPQREATAQLRVIIPLPPNNVMCTERHKRVGAVTAERDALSLCKALSSPRSTSESLSCPGAGVEPKGFSTPNHLAQ